MMRVGGQSGTAIVSVTSSAKALVAPPVISEAAKPAAAIMPLTFVVTVIFRFPPFGYRFFLLAPRVQAITCPLEARKM
jgi:hypothetical protein